MAHSLIAGMTEHGKTTLARGMCSDYIDMGYYTIVLDPLKDPRWRATFITDDGEEFLYMAKRATKCMLFLDEGSESVGRYNVPMQWTATQARHWGHSSHFIMQEAIQIAPIIRSQCTRVFLFASGKRAGKTLAEEFNAPELELCTSLRRGEYLKAVKGGTCQFYSQQRSYENALLAHARGRGIDRVGRGVEEKGGRKSEGNASRDDHEGGGTSEGTREDRPADTSGG